ncbi:MAG: sn-glycerol-3-phosphate ABC transporter ATP-binding protein UgpC [Actinomycetota bacterium]
MAEIALDEVYKIYPDGTEAVHALNLEIADAEFMVLVGPSGSGKTTALRMVAGLEDISRGSVEIGDRVVNDVPPKDRDIAMVFQNYALYPHMTVYGNMAFGLKLRSVARDEIDRRVREAARILGLAELLKRKPRNLSGGQRQRVAMGRAIVREPQAFLMDEPLSNLDAKLRVQTRAEIARLQRELHVTTIYVTHDQTEAMTLGDRVAVIRKGALQQADAPQTLYDRPANLFVAGFIGSPAMNMVEAEVQRTDAGWSVSFGDLRLDVDDEAVAAHPGLKDYEGRRVVVGIRPEDLEDASVNGGVPEGRRLSTTVDLREGLGSEVVIHFTINAPIVLTEHTKELAVDVGAEVLQDLEARAQESRSSFVARLDPHTTVREGDRIELAVDTGRLHFFDPETNAAIYEGNGQPGATA